MSHTSHHLVTAIIPVYNHENYVIDSIRSIINQTYSNMELIIINDGSTDKSHQRVLELVPECRRRFVNFRYLSRPNIGLTATLNEALSWSRGHYLMPLASDDIAYVEKADTLVAALQTGGDCYGAAFGNAIFINEHNQSIAVDRAGRPSYIGAQGTYSDFLSYYTGIRHVAYNADAFGSYSTLLMGNYLPAASSLIRREAVVAVGGWTPGNLIDDWEMWLKLAKRFRFMLVNKPLAKYRWHSLNTIRADGSVKCNYASLQLLESERDYCRAVHLEEAWELSRQRLVKKLLVSRGVGAREKVALLRRVGIAAVGIAGARWIAGRVSAYWR